MLFLSKCFVYIHQEIFIYLFVRRLGGRHFSQKFILQKVFPSFLCFKKKTKKKKERKKRNAPMTRNFGQEALDWEQVGELLERR